MEEHKQSKIDYLFSAERTKRDLLIYFRTFDLRSHPMTHYPVDAPLCAECTALELTFFDPSCANCARALRSAGADIAHVFAALRQWVPQVRKSLLRIMKFY